MVYNEEHEEALKWLDTNKVMYLKAFKPQIHLRAWLIQPILNRRVNKVHCGEDLLAHGDKSNQKHNGKALCHTHVHRALVDVFDYFSAHAEEVDPHESKEQITRHINADQNCFGYTLDLFHVVNDV